MAATVMKEPPGTAMLAEGNLADRTAVRVERPPATKTKRGAKAGNMAIRWTDEERQRVIERGIELRRADFRLNDKRLLLRAQQVLPTSRHRKLDTVSVMSQQWFRDGVDAGLEPVPLETVAGKAAAVAEADVDLNEVGDVPPSLESLDTLSLVVVAVTRMVAERKKDTETIRELMQAVSRIDTKLSETSSASVSSRAMLIKVLRDLDPAALDDLTGPAEADPTLPPHVREAVATNGTYPKERRPKLKICVVGGAGGLGARVMREVGSLADITYEHDTKIAVRKGFSQYDHVICTRYAWSESHRKARADIGREHVTASGLLDTDATIREIRRLTGVKDDVLVPTR